MSQILKPTKEQIAKIDRASLVGTQTDLILRILGSLNDDERLRVFGDLTDAYCRHCGCTQGTFPCRCWDDS